MAEGAADIIHHDAATYPTPRAQTAATSYDCVMPLRLVGSESPPPQPRCVVVRAAADLPAVLAIANADIPVLVVLRVDDIERRRITDMLTGWASGAKSSLDWLGANTIVVRSPQAAIPRLISHGLTLAVEHALGEPKRPLVTRDEERRLWTQAAAGSANARRRLIDAYSEFATLVAVWLRPPHLSSDLATRYAHEELDALVETPMTAPLLVSLVNRIADRVNLPGQNL